MPGFQCCECIAVPRVAVGLLLGRLLTNDLAALKFYLSQQLRLLGPEAPITHIFVSTSPCSIGRRHPGASALYFYERVDTVWVENRQPVGQKMQMC